MHIRKFIKPLLIVCISCLPLISTAQLPPDPGDDPDAVPIDGGVSLLIGAAALYGAKKFRDRNQQLDK